MKKNIDGFPYVKHSPQSTDSETLESKVKEEFSFMDQRRSVRKFSDKPIPKKVIEYLIKTASTAPSGAHKQPWTFCVVSNPDLKRKIRIAAEEEEKESYSKRMNEEWLEDLKPLGTDWQKAFLETAPYLIIVFKKSFGFVEGEKIQHYYVNESVGLASGFLLNAIHHAGLVSLTHTPSPMNFLSEILNRPKNEKPFLLIPIGYPAEDTWVPDIERRPLEEISEFYD